MDPCNCCGVRTGDEGCPAQNWNYAIGPNYCQA